VNDLLDLNSLRSGKMSICLAPFDLRALCREVVEEHNEGSVLSKEQQETIFEPFYRSPDAQSSATPGWGLGLAISKEIIVQHGGRLWVESSKEKGTTFFVALPLPTSSESV
jgi:signal transduction histidine kinase